MLFSCSQLVSRHEELLLVTIGTSLRRNSVIHGEARCVEVHVQLAAAPGPHAVEGVSVDGTEAGANAHLGGVCGIAHQLRLDIIENHIFRKCGVLLAFIPGGFIVMDGRPPPEQRHVRDVLVVAGVHSEDLSLAGRWFFGARTPIT
jgi:hypothetical protein